MTLWHKENYYKPRWICRTHTWSPTPFPSGILIFQGVLMKFNFLTKFLVLEKIVNLTWTLNMCTKAFFHFGEGQT